MNIPNWWHDLLGVSRELTYLETAADRKAAWKQVHGAIYKSKQRHGLRLLVLILVIVPVSLFSRRLLEPFLMRTGGLSKTAIEFIRYALLIIAAIACTFAALWLLRRQYQKRLREYLLNKGIPVCLHCGYNLSGLTEPRCPECGRTFEPAIL